MKHPSPLPFNKAKAARLGISTTSLTDLNSLDTWGRVLSVYDAPSETTHGERLFVFGLLMARRPERVLEIGFRFGGTSFLMACALEDTKHGRLVAIDPNPESVLDFSRFGDRFSLIRGKSPQDIARAVEVLGGPVDVCFLDGDHAYAAVLADLEAIGEHMADESYIIMHDPVQPDVQRATDEFLARHPQRVIDCGLVCPSTSPEKWSGLRLLRFTARN